MTVRYNLLSPHYQPQETDIFDFARHHGVGVLIKQALGQGILLRRHTTPPAFSRADHRSQDPQFHPAALTDTDVRLKPVRARFGHTPAALARVALSYALHRDPTSAVLVGFRDAHQIQTAVTSVADPLPPEQLTELHVMLHPAA